MKHLFKRTVVLLNDIENIENTLKKAIGFSTQHQTTLEVLFIHEEPLFSLPDLFLLAQHTKEEKFDKEKIKERILEEIYRLNPEIEASVLIYIDDTVDQIIAYGRESKEILVVTAYHESITPKLLEQTSYAYWVIKGDCEEYKQIVLPLDLSEKSEKSIELTQHLFPNASLHIVHDYRYLVDTLFIQENYLQVVPVVTGLEEEINQQRKEQEKKLFNHYKEKYNIEGDFIEEGMLLDEALIEYIQSKSFELVVCYLHDTELFASPTLVESLLSKLSNDFLILNI